MGSLSRQCLWKELSTERSESVVCWIYLETRIAELRCSSRLWDLLVEARASRCVSGGGEGRKALLLRGREI